MGDFFAKYRINFLDNNGDKEGFHSLEKCEIFFFQIGCLILNAKM